MATDSANCNVLIVGAGPAGIATGLLLARGGLSVIITERSTRDAFRVGETVPPAIRPLLTRLGLWGKFESDAHTAAFGMRSYWGSPEPVDSYSIANPYGSGWHLDRRRFNAMLVDAATKAGCSVRFGTRVQQVNRKSSNSWHVELSTSKSPRALEAEFVVDASGRPAAFARKHGASLHTLDNLVGAYSFFSVGGDSRQHDSFTLIESTMDGWWYSAILPDNRLAVALMTDGDLFSSSNLSDRLCWMEKVQRSRHTFERISDRATIGEITVHAAGTSRTMPVSGDQWLAVGDAAMSYDPLSGQGIQKALENSLVAADVIASWFDVKEDSAFVEYEQYLDNEFGHYTRAYSQYYRYEQRWPQAPFWKRRHTATWTSAMKHQTYDTHTRKKFMPRQ